MGEPLYLGRRSAQRVEAQPSVAVEVKAQPPWQSGSKKRTTKRTVALGEALNQTMGGRRGGE
jgi:hypothetical protein